MKLAASRKVVPCVGRLWHVAVQIAGAEDYCKEC
jgi:hypothetical protein